MTADLSGRLRPCCTRWELDTDIPCHVRQWPDLPSRPWTPQLRLAGAGGAPASPRCRSGRGNDPPGTSGTRALPSWLSSPPCPADARSAARPPGSGALRWNSRRRVAACLPLGRGCSPDHAGDVRFEHLSRLRARQRDAAVFLADSEPAAQRLALGLWSRGDLTVAQVAAVTAGVLAERRAG